MDLIKSSEVKSGECVAHVYTKRTAEVFGGPFACGVCHVRERAIVLYVTETDPDSAFIPKASQK